MTCVLMLVWDKEIGGDLRLPFAQLPGLQRGLIHCPTGAEPDAPAMAMQLEFDGIEALEAACGPDGALRTLPGRPRQQAFLRRSYSVAEPGEGGCSYLVHYPGPAQDRNGWLQHYADHHIPLMCRLPGIRAVEMLTRIDHLSSLPFPRDNHMQRNRVAFDSPQDLAAALASPIRAAMRADVDAYPPYHGGVFHFTMLTEAIRPIRKES
ncbi:EthD family reductase [Paracoccus xiamenensis]|uniref:EthD family reductase n=1 Tax=Paracoccus xiamenensis TaxID=2714901 RepID=UPI00140A1D0A|nr:EthD family reductase [Paracoccus xiamenensis]NHF72861.1 EthD family reductase [Paracoccus xiamenensis]